MFVTNCISTTKIQKISEITNFFRHYFLSRTEVSDIRIPVLYSKRRRAGMAMRAVPMRMSYSLYSSAAEKIAPICSFVNIYGVKSDFGCLGIRGMKHTQPHLHISLVN